MASARVLVDFSAVTHYNSADITFRRRHDFTGITVIPFCTSGGSGAGRTGETLGEQAGTGTFLASTRFSEGVSEAELQSWIDSH